MKILAIESSCDETAAAVVEDGRKVISSVVASQVEEHKLYGGVVPEIASRRHAEAIVPVVKSSLEQAELTLKEIDAIAVTYAPGLIGALLVGVNFAKGLSLSTGLPLVPTHHLRSHIASNYISNQELKPPFLCLVVSGGHSHIVMVEDYTKMRIIGRNSALRHKKKLMTYRHTIKFIVFVKFFIGISRRMHIRNINTDFFADFNRIFRNRHTCNGCCTHTLCPYLKVFFLCKTVKYCLSHGTAASIACAYKHNFIFWHRTKSFRQQRRR